MEKLSHILLATDGSEGALNAAKVAGVLARTGDVRVSIVTVHNEDVLLLPALEAAVLPGSAPYTPFPRKKTQKLIEAAAAKDILQPTVEALGEVNATVGKIHLWGHVVEQICTFAGDSSVDLIVIGRRGRSVFEELILGGVSSQVVTHASCAVLVAP